MSPIASTAEGGYGDHAGYASFTSFPYGLFLHVSRHNPYKGPTPDKRDQSGKASRARHLTVMPGPGVHSVAGDHTERCFA